MGKYGNVHTGQRQCVIQSDSLAIVKASVWTIRFQSLETVSRFLEVQQVPMHFAQPTANLNKLLTWSLHGTHSQLRACLWQRPLLCDLSSGSNPTRSSINLARSFQAYWPRAGCPSSPLRDNSGFAPIAFRLSLRPSMAARWLRATWSSHQRNRWGKKHLQSFDAALNALLRYKTYRNTQSPKH